MASVHARFVVGLADCKIPGDSKGFAVILSHRFVSHCQIWGSWQGRRPCNVVEAFDVGNLGEIPGDLPSFVRICRSAIAKLQTCDRASIHVTNGLKADAKILGEIPGISPSFVRTDWLVIGRSEAHGRASIHARNVLDVFDVSILVGSRGFCRHLCASVGQSSPDCRHATNQEMSLTRCMQRFVARSRGFCHHLYASVVHCKFVDTRQGEHSYNKWFEVVGAQVLVDIAECRYHLCALIGQSLPNSSRFVLARVLKLGVEFAHGQRLPRSIGHGHGLTKWFPRWGLNRSMGSCGDLFHVGWCSTVRGSGLNAPMG